MKKYLFTRKGLDNYKKGIRHLQKQVSDFQSQLRDAAENGGDGWHDNFSFEDIQRQISRITSDIQERKSFLNRATIVDKPKKPTFVSVGCVVKIQIEKTQKVWTIGGFGESNPKENIVAYNTPLGQELMQKLVGNEFVFNKQKVKILKIS